MSKRDSYRFETLGWREWVVFSDLGLPPMKAKIDTGARTSTLHAFQVRSFNRKGEKWVRFRVHPRQKLNSYYVACEAPIIDRRLVTDSGGHTQKRYVIRAQMVLGGEKFSIELTLTNRDTMRFRALLGRTALRGRFAVDPAVSFRLGGTAHSPPGN